MSNVSREMETLGGKKEMWEIKNTTTVIKNYFDGFMSTLDTSKEKISVSLKLCQQKQSIIKKTLWLGVYGQHDDHSAE